MQGEWTGELAGPDVWVTCRELIPASSVFAFLAEHREALFPPVMFADMYPSRNGRPSMPPQILAAAVTLQALHGLSDIETVQELRCDLRWKAACGLGLYDTAFDSSLLAYFRRRLSRSADPQRIFTAVRAVVAETGVLKGKVRRALDSTVLDDAVATQDTVTQIIAAIRRVTREVPGADEVVAAVCTAHDYTDPGKPKIAWNDEAARAELIDALVTDAIRVLAALPEREHGPKAADAIGLLALVAGQDVEPANDPAGRDGCWRIAKGTATDRVLSTVDPQARHVHKTRSHKQDGYKAHLAIEPETGIYTAVAIRPGAGVEHHEANTALDLLAHEPPGLHLLGDTAYCTSALRAYAREHAHAQFLKPPPLAPVIPGGFTLADFHIETATGTVTCPAGHTVSAGRLHADGQRVAAFTHRCAACPLKERCTTAKSGRQVRIRPDHDDLEAARHQAEEPDWQTEYRRWRPPVERAVAWLVHHGNRRLRYRGALANNTWIHTRAAALNLRTLLNLGLTRTDGRWSLSATA